MLKPCCDCTPVHVTNWRKIYVDGGVMYVVFMSGNKEYALAMGPTMALQGVELAKRALSSGAVLPLRAAERH